MMLTGLSQASMSRNVAALSKWHRHEKPGHDLVFHDENPMIRRTKLIRLTKKGECLAKKLSTVFV